jgi:hypothetical protein
MDIKTRGPAHQQPLVDPYLVHRKRESEAQLEYFLVLDLASLSALDVCEVVVLMVLLEKALDLLREEGEELFGRLRYHKLAGYGRLALREGEGGIAV